MADRSGGLKHKDATNYKVVCISLYVEDIARLEALVAALKARGNTTASKSAVIRYALEKVDVADMPKRRRRKVAR